MSTKIFKYFLVFCIMMQFCGKENDNLLYLSGKLEMDCEITGPAFLVISTTDDFEAIEDDPMEYIAEFVTVDPNDYNFNIDLSDTDLKVGQEVFIFGFVDNDYIGSFPNPTEGDYVGFYFEKENWETSYKLREGYNEDINITINRRVYDFDAEVSGTIYGDYTGDVIIVAFAGELNSFDFNDFDIDGVVGYKRLFKDESSLPYVMSIFPFGYDVPIEDVYLIAMYDQNGNGKPDGGEMIGFHTEDEYKIPTLLTIIDGSVDNKNIEMLMKLPEPSGYDVPIRGSIEMPEGFTYSGDPSTALFIFIANTDNPNEILEDPMDSVKYFQKVSPPETPTSIIDFDINMSETELKAGDDIFIMAFWDNNYSAGLAFPDEGDYIGFYMNTDAFSPTYKLQDEMNDEINFKVNREVFDFNAEIKGSFIGDYTGELMIVAYAGQINSLDLENVIDFDAIVGYQMLQKGTDDVDYILKILPFGKNVPIEDVLIIGFLDKNGNGKPDSHDKVGFYIDQDIFNDTGMQLPGLLTIDEGELNNIDILPVLEIPEPSGYDICISGSFEKPDGYDENSAPIFIFVIKTDDPNQIFDNPLSELKQFYKMPQGENEFTCEDIDLSNTDLIPGDDVMIIAIWDKDYDGGFPNPTPGDYVAINLNGEKFSFGSIIQEGENIIPEAGFDFKFNHKYYDHNSSIKFKLNRGRYWPAWPYWWGLEEDDYSEDDQVVVVAIQKGEFDPWFDRKVDINRVIGVTVVDISFDEYFEIKLLPTLNEEIVQTPFTIDDVMIFSILDKDKNGMANDGEPLGYFWKFNYGVIMPAWRDITDGINIPVDMDERGVMFSDITFPP